MTRTKVISAVRDADHWAIQLEDVQSGAVLERRARVLVNAAGPWAGEVIRGVLRANSQEQVRLVRGSHIVTRKLFDHDKCYFFQGSDGRIIFAIPYEQDFTLIGTTDQPHETADMRPHCTEDERDYLLNFASGYFKQAVTAGDIVWTYSGVRPLYDEGASSATAATREYVIKLDETGGEPVLNIFGGKITTYRRLAEAAMDKIVPFLSPDTGIWTAGVPEPGGDFAVDGVAALTDELRAQVPFLAERDAARLIRAYGTDAAQIFAGMRQAADLGQDFGAGITARELDWAIKHEWVQSAEDYIWRRSKLGLRLTAEVSAFGRLAMVHASQGPRVLSSGVMP